MHKMQQECARRAGRRAKPGPQTPQTQGGEALSANILLGIGIVCKNGADPDWFDATTSERLPTC